MKMTTTPIETTPASSRSLSPEPINRADLSAEEALTQRIFREGNGKGLIKFCRELALVLVRRYSFDENAADLRVSLVPSLTATLKCSDDQANCLIDLSLEMIHAKLHGKYRRTDVELGYLIAMATGAVTDVAAN